MPFKQHINNWSEIGMKISVILVNAVKLCILVIGTYFGIKIAFALFNFMLKLAASLPTWPY